MNGVRFLFAIMVCVANMIIYGLKVNIATAIIGMARQPPKGNETTISTPSPFGDEQYNWTAPQQSNLIGIYFTGYLVGMFPSGYFADRFNTKWVLVLCVFFNSFLTLLVPLVAHNYNILYGLRFVTGLLSAANLPIVNVLVGKWIVFEEKSLWVAIIYAGTSLGTVISILSTGWIMASMGWKMVFYIHGALPFIWIIVYIILFADSPEAQKWISEEERQKIITSPGHRSAGSAKVKVPWKSIFTSVPFWALLWTNTLGNFTWYLLLTQMPTFMSNILKYDIKSNATLSCVPFLLNVIVNPLLGRILDFGRRKGWWTQTVGRKLAVGLSCIPAMILLSIVSWKPLSPFLTVILMWITIVTSGAIFVGHLCNQNDLAPNYAGILMGITNTPGTISAFLMPYLAGKLNEGGHTFEHWQIIFGISIIAQGLAFVIFTLFGSAEIQPWNTPED